MASFMMEAKRERRWIYFDSKKESSKEEGNKEKSYNEEGNKEDRKKEEKEISSLYPQILISLGWGRKSQPFFCGLSLMKLHFGKNFKGNL